MACLICRDLERIPDFRRSRYFEPAPLPFIKSALSLRPKKTSI